MGSLRFYRRLHVFPGLTVNLSRSGSSLSVGVRRAHLPFGKRGVTRTVGVFLSGLAKVYRASPNTVAAYRGDLAAFTRFLGGIAVENITANQIRKYVARFPIIGPASVGLPESSASSATWKSPDPTRRMRLPKRDKRLPSVLSENEVEQLIGDRRPKDNDRPGCLRSLANDIPEQKRDRSTASR